MGGGGTRGAWSEICDLMSLWPQGRGHSPACSAARPSPRRTCSRSTRRYMCMSAASAAGTAGSSTRPSPTCGATGACTRMSGPTLVLSVASAIRPRWAPGPRALVLDPRAQAPSLLGLLLSLAGYPSPSLSLGWVGTAAVCPGCSQQPLTGSPQNAQQVHFRTHLEDKPHVCQFCSRGFREKGSLVRHVRHHTGEKPFKCYKCGRGFAEHGTLNRHLRTKGPGAVQWWEGQGVGPGASKP